MSDAADARIAELERELAGTQEMLALVLNAVDEPVVITHETVSVGLPNGAQIAIDDDPEAATFTFSLQVVE